MPDTPPSPRPVTLVLPLEERWTLHHVLLDRIDREVTADDPGVDPPPVELFQAFETLDAGETSFTVAQLEAMRALLTEYHHDPSWERDRPRIERLLHRVTDAIEGHETARRVD